MGLLKIKRQRHVRKGLRTPGPDEKKTLFHWFVYGLLRSMGFASSILPNRLARALGRGFGQLYWRLDPERRHTAMCNLNQVYGERKSDAEKQGIVRACCEHFGTAIVEILTLSRIDEKNFMNFVELNGVDGFHEGLKAGKGVILCSAHYGNWEVMNLALGYLGLPLSAMARPIDNPLVHDYLEKIRTRSGNRVIYKHRSVRKLLSNLGENRIIGIVNDQDVHDRNRMMVPFFGRDAATTPVPAALSYKTGAPLITGYAVPLGGGRYDLRFGELIWPNQEADKDAEVERLTRMLNQRLEAQIEEHPDCWMWIHQRYKTGPEGRTKFYAKG